MSASQLLRQAIQNSTVLDSEAESILPHRHTQYYGFWITQQWLIDLGKNIQHPNDHLYPPYIDEYFMRGFDHIQWAVGINPMSVEVCLQPKNGGAPPEYLDADGDVLILSVMSDDEEDYPIRPAQKQVDYLR
ncbi:hypothetical protein AZE42_06171 [Rhizopogon vesiculosus]|uniref:Uncharacterized protein n=1 Tax=Rhizopogon vesiculosus TaxID=180088 RepID=A0A1J8QXM3_9AGAM|nr:hypothetical protein AZE42_06171 [Rhizopogon vesiculosus]